MRWTLLLLFLVAGCVPKQIIKEVELVELPPQVIVERCVEVGDIPAPPPTSMNPKQGLEARGAASILDYRRLEVHAEKLRRMLLECSK